MFSRIVVPLDGTLFAAGALVPGRELARRFDARILLVRAERAGGLPHITGVDDEDLAELNLEAVGEAEEYLSDLSAKLRTDGFDADYVLYIAEPAAGIARAAAFDRADLIVMASHLRWSAPKVASTTLNVLGRSTVPILAWRVTNDGEPTPPPSAGLDQALPGIDAPIVVPLDGSFLAEAALDSAVALARTFGTYLVLVRAVLGEAQGINVVAAPGSQDLAEAQAYLDQVRDGLADDGIQATCVVRSGRALPVIEAAWRESNAALVTIASHGNTGTARGLIGSVAASLIDELDVPVLVIRQSGTIEYRKLATPTTVEPAITLASDK